MTNYLMLITEFNKNLKIKKSNINEVVDKMNEIEDLLKLNYLSYQTYDPTFYYNKVCRIHSGHHEFNFSLFKCINHYKHLTNDIRELNLIFKIGKKIANKFTAYFYEYDYCNIYHTDA